MTVDEILADPIEGLNLPSGSISLHITVIVEYSEPGSDNFLARSRLALVADEDLPPWTEIGMLRFAEQMTLDDIDDEREAGEAEP